MILIRNRFSKQKGKQSKTKLYETHPTRDLQKLKARCGSSMADPQSSLPQDLRTTRSKLLWRVLLIGNLAIGAYIFTRPRKKDTSVENHRKASQREVKAMKSEEEVPAPPIETTPIHEMLMPLPPAMVPVKVLEPIPEDQQRELFSWMLEEKRKVKTKDREEKKRIDEDKAILKQFIRAKSVPRF